MLRTTLAGLLAFAAFSALATPAQAVYVCGHQNDASDLVVGDDPVWRTHCTTENILSHECEASATVGYVDVTPSGPRCEPLVCSYHCPPPPAVATAAQGPCVAGVDPTLPGGSVVLTCATSPTIGYDCHTTAWVDQSGVHREYVECDSFLYCVTEPCPGSGPIRI